MYLPDASVVGAIGLLDLYGPQFYPADLKSSHEKVAFGTKRFEDQVNHRKFRMFFAVHELEAWILSQPEILPAGVRDALPEKPPESVNSHDNPAKLLDRLYTRFEKDGYKKIVNRTELFSKLDPLIAAAKCPRLAAMLEEMLTMARSAGL